MSPESASRKSVLRKSVSPESMSPKFRIAYFAHSVRSDWNNGNAHFLRGLLRALHALEHSVSIYEPDAEWSLSNLAGEERGAQSLEQFAATYSDLPIKQYAAIDIEHPACWRERLSEIDIVVVHEWNPPSLVHALLRVRNEIGFRMVFHDTHHRASSSPEQIAAFSVDQFDGVLVFGEVLRTVYRKRFGIDRVWTLHEAADTTVFKPIPDLQKWTDVVWVGNWGEGERSSEIEEFLLQPASKLREHRFCIYGVRYPEDGLAALQEAGVKYGGYLPNLDAPSAYAHARLTVHIPRQEYARAMPGIPTIRVFEALACGVPLISAPWQDAEWLFRQGDFISVRNAEEMRRAMQDLLCDPGAAQAQAAQGLETVLARHTCRHRAEQLTRIFEEHLS